MDISSVHHSHSIMSFISYLNWALICEFLLLCYIEIFLSKLLTYILVQQWDRPALAIFMNSFYFQSYLCKFEVINNNDIHLFKMSG